MGMEVRLPRHIKAVQQQNLTHANAFERMHWAFMDRDDKQGAIGCFTIILLIVGIIVYAIITYEEKCWTLNYENVTRVFMNTPNSYVIYYRDGNEIKSAYVGGKFGVEIKIIPSDQPMRVEQDQWESSMNNAEGQRARIFIHDETDVDGGSYTHGKGAIQKVNVVK